MAALRLRPLAALAFAAALGAAAAEEPAPVLLGAVLTLTGEGAERNALVAHGYLAAVDAVNAAGGVTVAGKARPLAIVFEDDRGWVWRARGLAERLARDRGVTVLLAGADAAMTAGIARKLRADNLPVVDPSGLLAAPERPSNTISMTPDLAGGLSPALAGLAIGYRMAGRAPEEIAAAVAAGSAPERSALEGALRRFGFAAAEDAPAGAGLLVTGPAAPADAPPEEGVAVYLSCLDALAMSGRRSGLTLCADRASGAAPGFDRPPWFEALETGLERDAAFAVHVLARAMAYARTGHGPMLAGALAAAGVESFAGRVRLERGFNSEASIFLYRVADGRLAPFDPVDPLGLAGLR